LEKQRVIRDILHLDLDAFYASVEQLDYPELRGLPVIVGGHPGRGVVCACSYEARRFGVHSAMPMSRALRLCPGAKVRPVRISRYKQMSSQVFNVFGRYTDLVEPLSVDEAFLDVTGSRRLFGSARQIAETIRHDIRTDLGLTISAGIAHNKFLAKLASERAKPDGIFEVPDNIDEFLLPLELKCFWGVGPVMLEELRGLGLCTVGDLRKMPLADLKWRFGKTGIQLHRLAHGEDSRPVEPDLVMKSISHEDTFDKDIRDRGTIHAALLDLAERVAVRLRRTGLSAKTLTLKVRYADFTTVTRSRTSGSGFQQVKQIHRVAMELLKKTEAGAKPVRLLGINLHALNKGLGSQGMLFDEDHDKRSMQLDQTLDLLRARYGEKGICRATLIGWRGGESPQD
jgi:DNA polymerase-4